jgi:hypothetical protein
MLVTLQEARDHLRSDTTADDSDLTLKINAASGAVLNYLKGASPWQYEYDSNLGVQLDSAQQPIPFLDSNGQKILRWEVRAAVLLMVGYLYKDRDENPDGEYEQGYLPKPITAILYPLRDPAVA